MLSELESTLERDDATLRVQRAARTDQHAAIPGRASSSIVARGSGKGLGLLQGLLAADLFRPEAAAGNIIPIEILRGRAIREPDCERAALGHGLVLDQPDVLMPS